LQDESLPDVVEWAHEITEALRWFCRAGGVVWCLPGLGVGCIEPGSPAACGNAKGRLDSDFEEGSCDGVAGWGQGDSNLQSSAWAEREGDARTPEGHYTIDSKTAASHYHKGLHVSYPNAEDRKRAAKLGASPGGAIMIHGLPNGKGWVGAGHRLYDWTLGCIAVTDEEIDEIWELVTVGTPVEIRP